MTTPTDGNPGNPWAANEQAPVLWQPAHHQPVPYGQPMPYQQPVYAMPLKSAGIAYLLWFFLGGFGAHHFYTDRNGTAVVMLVLYLLGLATIWLFVGVFLLIPVGIWLLVDLFLIPGYVRDANAKLIGFRPY